MSLLVAVCALLSSSAPGKYSSHLFYAYDFPYLLSDMFYFPFLPFFLSILLLLACFSKPDLFICPHQRAALCYNLAKHDLL